MRVKKSPAITFPMSQETLQIIMKKAEKGKIILIELRNELKMDGLDVELKRALRKREARGRMFADAWGQV